ncbi:MAG: hypothetical protein ACRDL5_15535, partial [Solirubrobacteraceae bacterium]
AEPAAVAAEAKRVQRLVLGGSRRRWFHYLREALELIERRTACEDPDVIAARDRATAVLANHHNLLLGLPGPGGRELASERGRLDRLTRLRTGVA